MKKLIIDGNDVYEIDLDCLNKKKQGQKCDKESDEDIKLIKNKKKGTD